MFTHYDDTEGDKNAENGMVWESPTVISNISIQ